MDAQFWNDTREPFIISDLPTITLASTNKALYAPQHFPFLGGQYFARPGKKIHIRMAGKITTAATPGNLSFGVYYGDGTDANGVLLQSSAAFALTANQTNLTWWLDCYVRCNTTGAAGTLFAMGEFGANVGVVASTLQPIYIPASAAAASGSCDLTVAKIISVQALRSGSTAETMTVQDMEIVSMN